MGINGKRRLNHVFLTTNPPSPTNTHSSAHTPMPRRAVQNVRTTTHRLNRPFPRIRHPLISTRLVLPLPVLSFGWLVILSF